MLANAKRGGCGFGARTADPSTALRSGRDDRGRTVTFRKSRDLDGRSYSGTLAAGDGSTSDGLRRNKLLFCSRCQLCPSESLFFRKVTALPLSSRRERSVVEGSAVAACHASLKSDQDGF